MKIKVICHIDKDKGVTFEDLVNTVDNLWGTGCPLSDMKEKRLPELNTIEQEGYVSILMPEEHAKALQYFLDNFPESAKSLADWWRIEWPVLETDCEGNLYPKEYPRVSFNQEDVDEIGDKQFIKMYLCDFT